MTPTSRDRLRSLLRYLESLDESSKRSRSDVMKGLEHAVRGDLSALGDRTSDLTVEQESALDRQVDLLVQRGVGVVSVSDPHYPKSLRDNLRAHAPPFLFYRGNIDLFASSSVGFCGSRHASERGLSVCEDIVCQLLEHDITITAGYAAGVDQLAHLTALRGGGRTIAVLAEGIQHFSVRQMLSDAWDWDRTLVVSEFLPNARWTVARAMTRNRTIVGLSGALIVIEARATGGTFEAGKAALSLEHPLFAPIYESITAEGNELLIKKGATPLLRSRTSGKANIGPVIRLLQQKIPAGPKQVML